ncbi:MAG: hypothetical protein IT204_17715 [Fimbriimonadaceae bacterium]|nr:hypothetical protein [Fimbriimonadaceae bacterium]
MRNVEPGPQIIDVGVHLLNDAELLEDQQQAAERILAVIDAFLEPDAGRSAVSGPDPGVPWLLASRPSRFVWLMGARGQGKTSTLLHCCAKLRERQCIVTQPLEPEWLLRDEDPFLAIAASLLECLESGEYERSRRDWINDYSATTERLREELVSICCDVAARSRIGAELQRQDFEGILGYTRKVLSNTQRHSSLVRRLRRWFADLLQHTDRILVILPIDDVDVARSQTMAVLNAARWYLCHPNVAVIFTADYETVHRAVLNELLAELPTVYTGGGGTVAADPASEEARTAPRSASRDELLAVEHRKDDEYARLLLQKLAPSGYRAQLRALPPQQRLTAPFFAQSGKVSLAELLEGVPLVAAIGSGPWYARGGVSETDITAVLRSFTEHGNNSLSTSLRQLIALYPTVLPTNLRQLINCINEIAFRTEEYRRRLARILAPQQQVGPDQGRSAADAPPSLPQQPQTALPVWLEAQDPRVRAQLHLWQAAESRYVVDVIAALGRNADIEEDSDRMVDDSTNTRLLDATTADQFSQVLRRIRVQGTTTTGPSYVSTKRTGERQRLSEASCALVSIFKEYTILRAGSPWAVIGDQELMLQHRFQQDIPRVALFDWLAPAGQLRGCSELATVMVDSLRSTLDWAPRTPGTVSLFYDRLDLGAPACLTTLRQAARYAHVLHADTDTRLDRIAEAMREAAGTRSGRPAEPQPELTYRTLGMIASRGNLELTGLYHALAGGDRLPFAVGGSFSATWPWLVADQEGTGDLLVALLRAENLEIDLVGRLLLLLRLARLPLAPALTVWSRRDSSQAGPPQIVAAIKAVVQDADAAGLTTGLDLAQARELLKLRKPRSQSTNLSLPLQHVARAVDYIDLHRQAEDLPLFIQLIAALEADSTSKAGATPDSAPPSWVELAQYAPGGGTDTEVEPWRRRDDLAIEGPPE